MGFSWLGFPKPARFHFYQFRFATNCPFIAFFMKQSRDGGAYIEDKKRLYMGNGSKFTLKKGVRFPLWNGPWLTRYGRVQGLYGTVPFSCHLSLSIGMILLSLGVLYL